MQRGWLIIPAVLVAAAAWSPGAAVLAEPGESWLSYADIQDPPTGKGERADVASSEMTATTDEWQKPLPMSFSIYYSLVSDYIFRGINFSEFAREGREKPNHQMGTSMSLDLAPLWGGKPGQCGEVGFDTWFEWFAGQRQLNPNTGENIQEIDYNVWYKYHVEPIATDVKLGWVMYVYPNVIGVQNDDRTHEWYIALAHNDAWLWRGLGYQGEAGILNPTVTWYHDMHVSGGDWIDFSISHPFELVRNVTFTPLYMLHVDSGWCGPLVQDDRDTRIAAMTYGIDLTYDMTELLQLPVWAGRITISGFLNFTDLMNQIEHYRPLLGTRDELYGGMKLAWSW